MTGAYPTSTMTFSGSQREPGPPFFLVSSLPPPPGCRYPINLPWHWPDSVVSFPPSVTLAQR
ncbi:hypothetical protein A4R35_08940 [Thermogemmatispora tikiterensis]|uniref:Uncharacterized protein n=1 Tax=Thermogemmatispora tikiterensis TaxID=1825093 RepID=A0A328VDL2_9CHLR|nr:hypothetical protein A4R35_08940 [Thermogemmatispora tikiterensis]